MKVHFPGGMQVDAFHEGFWIHTDQPVAAGGGGSAPSPFDLFLASIGTCAGFYALRFCQERSLDVEGLALWVVPERDASRRRVTRVRIELALPRDFPAKYQDAIRRAIDQCSVKRHLVDPPEVELVIVSPERPAAQPEARPAVPVSV